MSNLAVHDLVQKLAERAGVPAAQVQAVLRAQAALAYEHARARVTFPIPGLGALKLVDLPTHASTLQFGQNKGKVINMPARSRLKFMLHTTAVEAVHGDAVSVADVLAVEPFPSEEHPGD